MNINQLITHTPATSVNNMVHFSKEGLFPEESRAVMILEQCLETINDLEIPRERLSIEEVTKHDNRIFTNGFVNTPNIPRQQAWIWNQSKGRKNITSSCKSVTACFYKLNTRKAKHSTQESPKYKLWVFHLQTSIPIERTLTFFWCEKGDEPSPLNNELLEELSFLRPFVSYSCATQLGWGFQRIRSENTFHATRCSS